MLSIDIGIKNLALCITDNANKILYWEVLNISNMDTITQVCCSYCKNNAKFTKLNNNYCIKHSKTQKEYFIPTGELLKTKINKYTVIQLREILDKYNIEYDKKDTKKKYIELLNNRLLNSVEDTKPISECNLIDICRIMTIKLDNNITQYIGDIKVVLIENQISPIANRMKSIQSMVTQYCVMKCAKDTDIVYVSATNKLKGINTNSYTERKKVGIEKCKDILLSSDINREWLEYFNKHKKKDDLSDCYIQGQWYINKNV